MSTKTIEENESLEQQKIAATESFCQTLQLDMDKDGVYIATLIEDLANRFPNEWISKLDDIMIKAHSKRDKSVKDAMFYLGDIVTDLDKRLIKIRYADDLKEMELQISLSDDLINMMRGQWNPNDRQIAGSVSDEFIPEWWTYHEADQGKYDVTIAQYMGGNVRKISEILNGER